MFKLFIGTSAIRFATLLAGFGVVLTHTRFLAPADLGNISLFVLGVSLSSALTEFYGGAHTTYLASRVKANQILPLAFVVSFISALIFTLLYYLFGYFNAFALVLFGTAAALQTMVNVTYHFLLGHQRVLQFNLGFLIQQLLLLAFCLLFYNVYASNFSAFVLAYTSSTAILLIIAGTWLYSVLKSTNQSMLPLQYHAQVFKLGVENQAGVLMQLVNYRLLYFGIEKMLGAATLGLFSLANQLIDALGSSSKAIASVQYSQASKQTELKTIISQTPAYLRISVGSYLILSLAFFFFPISWFTLVFGEAFEHSYRIVLWLLPSGLLLAISRVVGNIFSSIGAHHVNRKATSVGLFVNVLLIYPLLSQYELKGAAALLFTTFFFMLAYQLYSLRTPDLNR